MCLPFLVKLSFSLPLSLLLLRLMHDKQLGPACFPSQLRGRKTEMEGGEMGGMVGSDMRNLVSVGKNLLSLHMAHREDDKYSCSN